MREKAENILWAKFSNNLGLYFSLFTPIYTMNRSSVKDQNPLLRVLVVTGILFSHFQYIHTYVHTYVHKCLIPLIQHRCYCIETSHVAVKYSKLAKETGRIKCLQLQSPHHSTVGMMSQGFLTILPSKSSQSFFWAHILVRSSQDKK